MVVRFWRFCIATATMAIHRVKLQFAGMCLIAVKVKSYAMMLKGTVSVTHG